jgi:hypothetical protein
MRELDLRHDNVGKSEVSGVAVASVVASAYSAIALASAGRWSKASGRAIVVVMGHPPSRGRKQVDSRSRSSGLLPATAN